MLGIHTPHPSTVSRDVVPQPNARRTPGVLGLAVSEGLEPPYLYGYFLSREAAYQFAKDTIHRCPCLPPTGTPDDFRQTQRKSVKYLLALRSDHKTEENLHYQQPAHDP